VKDVIATNAAISQMSNKQPCKSNWLRSLIGLPLAILLLPIALLLAVPLLILWVLVGIALSILVWVRWCTRGKDILFVYSDSPIWHDYIEGQIIPKIRNRSVILNWSARRHWLNNLSFESLVFRHVGGDREFNPMAVYFRPLRRHQTFRFYKAFHDYKRGKRETLQRIEADFFGCIGIEESGTPTTALPANVTSTQHEQL
jgi:hypothetical protein